MANSVAGYTGGRYLFTSESVTEGHPDKVCDQISDAILDAILEKDPAARVACETVVTTGLVVVVAVDAQRARGGHRPFQLRIRSDVRLHRPAPRAVALLPATEHEYLQCC